MSLRPRTFAAFAGLAAWACATAVHAGLPQVNLTVAWRLEDASQRQDQRQVLQGQVILDTRGRVIGRTGWGATTVTTERHQQGEQVLRVLNGQQARLFVGRQVGRQTWQLVWSPQGVGGGGGTASGPGTPAATGTYGVQSQMQWLDLGDGLVVRPRWPGGRQPVTLEVEARSSRALGPGHELGAGFEPDGQVGRTDLSTSLVVPLGQWTVLARSGVSREADANRSGTSLSTRSLDEQGSQTLWVRVSTDALTEAPTDTPSDLK